MNAHMDAQSRSFAFADMFAWCRHGARLVCALAVPVLAGCGNVGGTAIGPSPAGGPGKEAMLADALGAGLGRGAAIKIGDSGSGNYLAGRHAQRIRDFGAAAAFLSRALADAPESRALVRTTYRMLLADGKVPQAADLARRALNERPSSTLANLVIAVEAAKRGAFGEARSYLSKVNSHGFGGLIGPLLIAWTHAGEGKTDAAIAALKPLQSREQYAKLYHLHAGLIFDAAGRLEEAEKHFRAANDAGTRSVVRVVQALGAQLSRSGKAGEARALFEDYNAENPDSRILRPALEMLAAGKALPPLVGGAGDGLAEALFNVAGTLNRQNASAVALVLGRLALHLRPDLDLARLMVAGILEIQGRYETANEIYRSIDAGSPLKWSARLRQAANLELIGQVDGAISVLRDMAYQEPDEPDAWITLGNLLRAEKRFVESVEAYDAALKVLGSGDLRQWALYYSRGIALERSRQWPRAEADFRRALELEPEQPYVLNYLGYSWVDQGINLLEARRMIERAVALRPNDGYIVDSLGWTFYRLGQFEQSVIHLERAAELRPQDPIINDHLGDAYWRVGRHGEARFQWRRALFFGPETDQVDAIKLKLKNGLAAPPPAPSGPGIRDQQGAQRDS